MPHSSHQLRLASPHPRLPPVLTGQLRWVLTRDSFSPIIRFIREQRKLRFTYSQIASQLNVLYSTDHFTRGVIAGLLNRENSRKMRNSYAMD
jgi:hypothetical protein